MIISKAVEPKFLGDISLKTVLVIKEERQNLNSILNIFFLI